MTGVSQLLSSMSSSLLQFTTDLHKHPEILNVSENDLLRNFLNGNFSLPNASVLLQQLDTIDNAACGWVHFMAKVRLHPLWTCRRLEQHPPPTAGLCRAKEGSDLLRSPSGHMLGDLERRRWLLWCHELWGKCEQWRCPSAGFRSL